MPDHLVDDSPDALPLTPLTPATLADWRATAEPLQAGWAEATGFAARAGEVCLLPGPAGRPAGALFGCEEAEEPWSYAGLPAALPAGRYRLAGGLSPAAADHAALGWALGTYVFTRYRKSERRFASLVWPGGVDRDAVTRAARATFLVRDLINTPANDLGPGELAAAAEAVATANGADCTILAGDALLRDNWPTVHAVGRAAAREPRLVDIRWGETGPRITLVGKGVCFDTGGLDIKPSSGMLTMKKDMGGAAQVLGLAQMIMEARLPCRLRVLIPAVENAISGDAFRPLDVIRTRKGLTVEVGNTDAEGRLILCDALAEADTESPDLVIDCATLTGAARVALGTDVPALFCNDDATAESLLRHAATLRDPLWRLPLWAPYRSLLDSKVADMNNVSQGGFGGAITAALFLQAFVGSATPWVHLDMMAWNPRARPGRPEGGEAMGLRALYALVAERCAAGTSR